MVVMPNISLVGKKLYSPTSMGKIYDTY